MNTRWISRSGILLIGLSGCHDDERVVRMAQQSIATQQRQNKTISRQSQAVVDEAAKLAEKARFLVDQDAKARGEILAAQRNLQDQAADIDNERSRLMELRVREPVIAEALQTLGGTLLCLLPLLLIGMLLRPNQSTTADFEHVNELLVQELTGNSQLLLDDRPTPSLLEQPAQPNLPPPF